MKRCLHYLLLLLLWSSFSSFSQSITNRDVFPKDIKTGSERTEMYVSKLANKRVAICANQTSTINQTHLVDSLLSLKVNIVKVFSLEHGFRGDTEAGKTINESMDEITKLPIVSLYGKSKKPSVADMTGVDVVIFDIQDVGVRFYTYISSLHYIMEACAENNVELIVLDRPNPNGYFVDGPVLDMKYSSFVGMHPVPIAHGMTIGEYARMINGEGWLAKNEKCKLTVISVYNYNHTLKYQLPIPPSPNLATMEAIYLYPSLCLFEGTSLSIGRGTNKPFEVVGHPDLTIGDFYFTPKSIPGKSENPPLMDKKCRGFELSQMSQAVLKMNNEINIFWLIDTYKNFHNKKMFFNDFFVKLAGNPVLRQQIEKGVSEDEIKKSWSADIEKFKKIRKKYLLYTDFE